jgi:hypothetical protein
MTNFHSWKTVMRAMFQGRQGWWDHIEGGLTVPPSKDKVPVEYSAWNLIDTYARSAIILTLSPSLIMYAEPSTMTAKETWDKVCAPHQPKGMSSFALLFRQLWQGSMYQSGTPMQSHIDQFTSIANKLAEMGEPVPDMYLACALLFSVSTDWEVRQSVTLNTLPSTKTGLFQHVANDYLQEERTRTLNRAILPAGAPAQLEAFHVQRGHTQTGPLRSPPSRPSRRDFVCTYCNRYGHLEDRCWDKEEGKPRTAKQESKQESHLESHLAVFLDEAEAPRRNAY